MVTRSGAIERIAKMVCFQGTPCVTCVEDAEPYLDALLDYLEETIDGDFEFMDSSGRTQVAPIREALLFRDLLPVLRGEAADG